MSVQREKSINKCWLAVAALCCALPAFTPTALGYCTAGSTTDDEFISSVTVGTIANTTAAWPAGGYLDLTAIATDMEIGQSYPITVTNGPPSYSSDRCAVWIDWNQDDDFDDAGEAITMAGSPGVGPYSGTILVPNGATLGATRMRVRIAYSAAPLPCGSVTYGSTEDYTINVLPPTLPTNPTVALALSQANGLIGTVFTATATVAPGANPASTGLAVSLDATQIDGGTVTMYDDGTHGDATIGDNVFTNDAVTVGPAATNGDKTLTATVTDAELRSGTGDAAFRVGYCVAAATTADEYIESVVTGSINHFTAAWPTGGYQDLTSISTVMFLNQNYPITVTNGVPDYADDQCAVWIDWNHNGLFTDSGEAVTMTGSPGTGPYTATIAVPPSATIGTTTMRVRIAYNAAPLPCGSTTYGSTEDYAIDVQTPPPEGACCTGDTCAIVPTGTCAGTYYGDGSTCVANLCVAACCHDNTCEDLNATACAAVSGVWHQFTACAPGGTFFCPPPNDNCSAVTPVELTANVVQTFTGDNRGSTNDCESFPGGNAWIAFTLPETCANWNIKLDYCTTTPAFENAWLNLANGCPCASFTAAGVFNTTECGDGNVTILWSLPPGTYYYPILMSDVAPLAYGPYTINVVAECGYCASASTSTGFEYIKRVTIGTIDNSPEGTPRSNYADYRTSVTPTDIGIGVDTPIDVFNGYTTTYTTDICHVFVDWNHNFSFADPGESYLCPQAADPPNVNKWSGVITAPPEALLGPTVMRVKMVDESVNAPPNGSDNPCGSFSYGEVEDYTVNVVVAETAVDCSAGDMNHDGQVDGLDIQKFVDVLTGTDITPQAICDADVDGNGATVFLDLDGLVQRLLAAPYYTITAPANPPCDGSTTSITINPAVDAAHLLFVRNTGVAGDCTVKATAYDAANTKIGGIWSISPGNARSLPVGTVRVDYYCPSGGATCKGAVGP